MGDRPTAFAADGFDIVAHDSAPIAYPQESHAGVQICVPMIGARYTVTRETETGSPFEQELGPRDILIVPTAQPHAVHWLQRAGIVSFQLSEHFVEETLDVSRLRLPDSLAVRDRFVTVAAAELYASMISEAPIAPVFAEALAVRVIHRIASIASRNEVRTPGTVRRLTSALVRRVERYIDDNLERHVTLSELAALAGFSRWYFLRVFAESVGTSPHDYVMGRRMKRARDLLRTTERSVMEIAGDVGMTHSHFSRVFARRLGVTPSEFRRIHRA